MWLCFVLHGIFIVTVKQDLVYNATTGDVVGFVNIGERFDKHSNSKLASHALTVYAKSFCGNPGLKYPVAYFASDSITGSQLTSIMWEAVGVLEHSGLKVRRLYEMLLLLLLEGYSLRDRSVSSSKIVRP